MYVETARMIIRNFTPEDAADLHDIFGDDETMKNCEPAYDFEKTKKLSSGAGPQSRQLGRPVLLRSVGK